MPNASWPISCKARSELGGISVQVLMSLNGGIFLRGRKEPFDYLAASIYEFVEPGRFLEDLRKCGFRKVRYRPLQNGIAGIYVGVKDGA